MKLEPFEKKIWLATAKKHDEKIKYIQEAFDTNWITTEGTNLVAIEQQMSEKLGCKYAVALSCGTAALHLAVKLAGVKEGDTVFCTDMTFDATVNAVMY
jgi:dTDP-4-amino-4,6-dideoxygalactose transaminase